MSSDLATRVTLQFLVAADIKMTVFSDVMPCSLIEVNWCVRGA